MIETHTNAIDTISFLCVPFANGNDVFLIFCRGKMSSAPILLKNPRIQVRLNRERSGIHDNTEISLATLLPRYFRRKFQSGRSKGRRTIDAGRTGRISLLSHVQPVQHYDDDIPRRFTTYVNTTGHVGRAHGTLWCTKRTVASGMVVNERLTMYIGIGDTARSAPPR